MLMTIGQSYVIHLFIISIPLQQTHLNRDPTFDCQHVVLMNLLYLTDAAVCTNHSCQLSLCPPLSHHPPACVLHIVLSPTPTLTTPLPLQSPRHHLPVVPESAESHPLPGVQPLQVADHQDRAGPAAAHHAGPLPLQHARLPC